MPKTYYQKNRKKILEYQNEYYQKNRKNINEKTRKRFKKWRDKNREEYRNRRRKHYWKHREKILKRAKEYRQENLEKIKKREKEYRKKHPRKSRQPYRKLRFLIFQRDNFTCQYCGRKAPEVILETDHIYPKSKGGKNKIDNYITACRECNQGKGDILLKKEEPA